MWSHQQYGVWPGGIDVQVELATILSAWPFCGIKKIESLWLCTLLYKGVNLYVHPYYTELKIAMRRMLAVDQSLFMVTT